VEGQVIPPPGMTLGNEMWIVTDFSSLATGIVEDLAQERAPLLDEIQERQEHVRHARADIDSREERIRLIQGQISAGKEEIAAAVKTSRDATQQILNGVGAQLDNDYQSQGNQLIKAIADRARSLHLNYAPDDTYSSPEAAANAYRLALYEASPGVDSAKEIADLTSKIDDLQQRIDGIASEEIPLKAELQQAQADLALAQSTDATLDDKYFRQLDSLPGEAILQRIPLKANGRFSWVDDTNFMEGEKEHPYLIFARATRSDGRQYWALHSFSIGKNQTLELIFEPGGFESTKAILRPDLSASEQEQ
jgi:hypothetical protein